MTRSNTERIRGRRWMQIRKRIFMRDCGMCQECQRKGRITKATEVDHVVALTNGGTNDDDNLVSTCSDCHKAKTNADLGNAPRTVTGLDGWPVEQQDNTPIWRRNGYR